MQLRLQRRLGLLAAGSLVLTGLATTGASAAEPKTSSVITGSSTWYTQAYDNFPTGGYLNPRQADVTGPNRAPFGTSSHRMVIGESSAQTELYRTNAYDGTLVADLTRLEYSGYAQSSIGGSARQPVYLRLSVDTDNNGTTDDSLFFYPANNGPVANGTWQNFDVAGGEIDVNGDGGGTTTLAQYAATHVGAKLVNDPYDEIHDAGALSLIVGGSLAGDTDPQTNGEYFVDRVIVGENDQDTLYDLGGGFEVNGGTSDLTVSPANDQGWKFQAYDANYLNPNQTFADGPGVPPLGIGSVRASLPAGEPDRVELFRTTQYDGTLLRDLRAASYSTYVDGNAGNPNAQQPHYLRLSLDNDGNGSTDETLFYYPANNGTVQQNTWQTWNAAAGVWNINADGGTAYSLADYLVAHPDSRIVANGDSSAPEQPEGGVALVVGAGGAGQTNGEYFIDNVTISRVDAASGQTVTGKNFDLEPTLPSLVIGNTAVSEGNNGATITFGITLSRPVARAVTVQYATVNGTATAGKDYRAKSGTVTIPAGSTSGTVLVSVISDKVRESNETFRVNLSGANNATIADGSGLATIVNDDTKLGIVLKQATQNRVRVYLATGPVRPFAAVKIYRVLSSGALVRVANTRLNSDGRLSIRLAKHYKDGTRVKLVAVVQTANGAYASARPVIRIR